MSKPDRTSSGALFPCLAYNVQFSADSEEADEASR